LRELPHQSVVGVTGVSIWVTGGNHDFSSEDEMPEQAAVEMLLSEIAKKENELEVLKQALAVLSGETVGAARMVDIPKSREFEHMGIVEATKLLLAASPEPLDTRTIADTLLDRGIRTRSKNYTATVYSTLDNSPAFRRTKDSRWELAAGD
jgi:hypothetical protein